MAFRHSSRDVSEDSDLLRRLFPCAYLFPFGGDGRFKFRNAGRTGALALFARRRLAVDLFLQHLDTAVDTGQFEVYLLLLAA